MNSIKDYEQFRKLYAKQYSSKLPRSQKARERWPLIIGIFIVFLSSAMVSAIHTVPIAHTLFSPKADPFVRAVTALAASVAIEGGIFLIPWISRKYGNRLIDAFLVFAMVIAITANFVGVIEARSRIATGETIFLWHFAINLAAVATFIIGATFGVGMPILALIMGKLLVSVSKTKERDQETLDKAAEKKLARFERDCVAAYNAKFVRSLSDSVRSDTTGQDSYRTGYGHSRTSDAAERVKAHLEANPGDERPVRTIAAELGVSKTVVSDVRRSMNGHSD